MNLDEQIRLMEQAVGLRQANVLRQSVLTSLRELKEFRARVSDLESLMFEVRSVLDGKLGDTDALLPGDEEDLREQFPLEYCCIAISRALPEAKR